jgi:prolyl-tRNA editing enzyme YbaK/EbsC (Cys-tRNA(Pro) deacylase)
MSVVTEHLEQRDIAFELNPHRQAYTSTEEARALGDSHARLASEEELGRDLADYQLGALPPLGALVGASVYVDPEVLRHDTVAFAAGTQTESVKLRTEELFGGEQARTVPLVRQPERGSGDAIV